MAICDKWAVTATVIGEVTSGDRLTIEWHGETVVDVPANRGPRRPGVPPPVDRARRSAQAAVDRDRARAHGPARNSAESLLSAPNNASKAWVTDQYDRYVRGNTVLARRRTQGCCASTSKVGRGAIATDCNALLRRTGPVLRHPTGPGRGPTATSLPNWAVPGWP